MPDRQLIAYLRYAHGLYNGLMFLLFIYQGTLGLRIRRHRKASAPLPRIIKRHRKNGPVLALMGTAGFFSGQILVYLDKGHIIEYPPHFFTGLAIAVSIAVTYFLSKNIRGPDGLRTPHFMLGAGLLCLYAIQAFLGIGILF